MTLKFHLPGFLLTEVCFEGTKVTAVTLTALKRKTLIFALRFKDYPRQGIYCSCSVELEQSHQEKGRGFGGFTRRRSLNFEMAYSNLS